MPLALQRTFFLSILAFYLSGCLNAQSSSSTDPEKDSLSGYIQMKYGLDQALYNGYQYYMRFVKYKGDPFFPEDSFYGGSVSIRGVEYDHLRLKYNCFSQFLVLEYTDYQGRYNQLILNTAHIDSFQMETSCYQKLSLPNEESLFYQVVSSGAVTCYIHWAKDIHATSDDLQYSYAYTRPLGTYYVSYKGEIRPFTSRNSFLSIFPETMVVEIKKYLRNQRFPFKEATPGDIQNLLNYINRLEETLSEH